MTFRALCGSLWYRVGLCGPLCGWHVTHKAQHGQTWRQSLTERRKAAFWGKLAGFCWQSGLQRLWQRVLRLGRQGDEASPKNGTQKRPRRATSDPFRRLGNGQAHGKTHAFHAYTGALARGARAARGRAGEASARQEYRFYRLYPWYAVGASCSGL